MSDELISELTELTIEQVEIIRKDIKNNLIGISKTSCKLYKVFYFPNFRYVLLLTFLIICSSYFKAYIIDTVLIVILKAENLKL